MVAAVLFVVAAFLALVLGFVFEARAHEARKRRAEKTRKASRQWATIFERTDLKAS